MILEARKVVAGYGRLPVLHGVSLAVDESEAIAIVGPNGAGKSTFMKVLARQLPLMGGELSFQGEECGRRDPVWAAQHGIGFVPQTGNVFGELTVRENLRIGVGSRRDAGRAIAQAMDRFPMLGDRSDQRASSLSGGERQILAISSALLSEPSILLLDEPTTGIAPKIAALLIDWISEISERGTALVWIVEQMPRPVLERVARAYMLEAGRVKFEGDARSLLEGGRLEELFLQQS